MTRIFVSIDNDYFCHDIFIILTRLSCVLLYTMKKPNHGLFIDKLWFGNDVIKFSHSGGYDLRSALPTMFMNERGVAPIDQCRSICSDKKWSMFIFFYFLSPVCRSLT